jgi:carboxyl-terminal processing protease
MKYIYRNSLVIVLVLISIYTGYVYGQKSDHVIASDSSATTVTVTLTPTSIALGGDLLSQVKGLIDTKFISWKATYTPPTSKDLEYGMIKGYVESYKDPYTTFFPPQEAKSFNEQVKGSFGGVGMEVGSKDGHITVIAPIKDSPAVKAGVKSGDIITAIDKKDTSNLTVEEAVRSIRGELGTKVEITFYRKGVTAPIVVTITRAEIKIPTADTEIKNGVFVIHLYNFSQESAELFRQSLVTFQNSGKTRLLIDLRGNPGGYLEAAVNIASLFLKEGTVVVSEKGSKQYPENIHRSKGYNVFPTSTQIAVLVDSGSASASEILAGALQDNKVAKVYGQKSFGKGSVQELINLDDGSSIKITVATWYTPNGTSITEHGITPDITVARATTTTAASELNTVTLLMLKNK